MMLKRSMLAFTAVIGMMGLANAADLPPPHSESDWTFTVAPYGWLPSINGDAAAFGSPITDIDFSMGDVLQGLDMGLMGVGEARNGRFTIGVDAIWAKLSGDQGLSGVVADKVKLGVEEFIGTGTLGYSVYYSDDGNFDVIAGARVWSVSDNLDFKGGGLLGGKSFDDSATWVDPLVGVKGRLNIDENVFLTGWGVIGGFGVSSKLMWDVMGSVGYKFSDSFSLTAGWRVMSVDYSNNGFVVDVVESGPIVGAVFNF